jgi:hypothetical protein
MSNLPTNIQKALDQGYEFRLGEYISAGINIVQRNIGLFIAFTLVFFVLNMAASIIPIVGPLGFAMISPALLIGIAIAAHKIVNNQGLEFGDFFNGMQRIGDFFMVVLITIGLALLLVGPGLLMMFAPLLSNLDEFSSLSDVETFGEVIATLTTSSFFWLGLFLILAGSIYLSVSLIWAPYFVWFYNMRAWDAVQASRKLAAKQWFMTFIFLIVIGLLGAVGLLLFCVGILFTYPAAMCAQYAAFADITGLNDVQDNEPDIIEHFSPLG